MSPLARLLAAAFLCACSSAEEDGAPAFPASAYEALDSESGALHIEIRTAPDQPPTPGATDIELRIDDAASGDPIDGLDVAVTPWMPSHAHGASTRPAVTALGDGRYIADDVSFYMPGEWELRIELSGQGSDRAVPTLDVR